MFGKQVIFRFTGDQIKALDQLMCGLHTETHAEALRRGINLANVVASADREGYRIVLEKQGEPRQILKIS